LTRQAVIAGLLALAGSPAAAQEAGAAWNLIVDEAQHATLAVTATSTGQTIAVRCLAGQLDVLVAGLPSLSGRSRYLQTTWGSRSPEGGFWLAEDTTVFSETPARSARLLRRGGRLTLMVAEAPEPDSPLRPYGFELPRDAASVDRVLEACGAPMEDPRDDLSRWTQPRVFPPNLWSRPPVADYPSAAAEAGIESGFAVVGCIVGQGGRLQDCRVERENPQGAGFGEAAMRAMRGTRMSLTDDSAPEIGQVVTTILRFQTA
jgi:TonB family protein